MDWSIALHGGAGAMRRMGPAKEVEYRAGLDVAIRAGAERLEAGEPAVAAVVAAVRSMEASGAFNAGHGACLTSDGCTEADAAVMDGGDRSIGAVTIAPDVANPVEIAELIRLRSPHCLLAGPAAVEFAAALGVVSEQVHTSADKLARYRRQMSELVEARPQTAEDLTQFGGTHDEGDTVGAVAVDASGRLAVAASTGGIWLKHPGRVGDSPVPGAGFWANDTCAICATGTGEFILRTMLCHDVAWRMSIGESITDAATNSLDALSARFGPGRAGLIAIDIHGGIAMPFDTEGMGRAAWRRGEVAPRIAVWPEDTFGPAQE